MRNVLVREHPTTTGLRAEPVEVRVAPVDGDPERFRERDLVGRHAEGEDHRELRLPHELPDPADGPRAREKLSRKRLVATVDERDRYKTGTRLGSVELGNEAEVVVQHTRVDRP